MVVRLYNSRDVAEFAFRYIGQWSGVEIAEHEIQSMMNNLDCGKLDYEPGSISKALDILVGNLIDHSPPGDIKANMLYREEFRGVVEIFNTSNWLDVLCLIRALVIIQAYRKSDNDQLDRNKSRVQLIADFIILEAKINKEINDYCVDLSQFMDFFCQSLPRKASIELMNTVLIVEENRPIIPVELRYVEDEELHSRFEKMLSQPYGTKPPQIERLNKASKSVIGLGVVSVASAGGGLAVQMLAPEKVSNVFMPILVATFVLFGLLCFINFMLRAAKPDKLIDAGAEVASQSHVLQLATSALNKL